MARKRGEDAFVTKDYVCLVVDKTDDIAYLIGGLGKAENTVDRLMEQEHELKKFGEKYLKVGIHHGRLNGLGIDLSQYDYDNVIVMPNGASFSLFATQRPEHLVSRINRNMLDEQRLLEGVNALLNLSGGNNEKAFEKAQEVGLTDFLARVSEATTSERWKQVIGA